MSVITLHIFFAGLVAFVPSPDGRELTVLVPQAGHEHVLSDRSTLEPHRALLVARAGGCQADGAPGLCGAADAGIAKVLFAGEGAKAPEELESAILHGAAWGLDGVDLALPSQVGGLELHDFDQIADLDRIAPGNGGVDRPLLNPDPPAGKLAARLTLSSGRVSPYRLVQIEGNAPALRFRDLKSGREAASGYSRPLATWVMAEIQIPGNFVELEVRPFGRGDRRKVRLMPDERGQVEIVVMNVVASRNGPLAKNEPDKHFELYYELTAKKPAFRPVPYVPAGSTGPATLQVPQKAEAMPSDLLTALRLGDPRGVYDRLICPVAQLAAGQ
jgi:hypothetical protein